VEYLPRAAAGASRRTIVPLVRLGLLEFADDGPERLLVSARGRATLWRFLERGGQYPKDLTLV
jgi:hypothetical protein